MCASSSTARRGAKSRCSWTATCRRASLRCRCARAPACGSPGPRSTDRQPARCAGRASRYFANAPRAGGPGAPGSGRIYDRADLPGVRLMPNASFRRPVPPWSRGAGLATPVFWAAVAALARALLRPVFGDDVPYLTAYFAVLLSAWSGGLGSGALALFLSLGLSLLFAPGPLGDRIVSIWYSYDALRFSFVGIAVAFVIHSLRVGRDRARRDREELEVLFDSIGDGVITTDAHGR